MLVRMKKFTLSVDVMVETFVQLTGSYLGFGFGAFRFSSSSCSSFCLFGFYVFMQEIGQRFEFEKLMKTGL